MIDSAGEPMRVGLVPWLDIGLTGVERMEALLLPAIESALMSAVDTRKPLPSVALALSLPLARPGLHSQVESLLRDVISRKFGTAFASVATLSHGHAAGLMALDLAGKHIADGRFDACVVAGVESYLEPDTLEWLEKNDQLHGAGALNNAWGFVPGEAAGAVLICNEITIDRLGLEALALVRRVGTSIERNRIKTDTVCIGEGLTAAFRGGLSGLPEGALVTDVFCDMNGEPYRADEFGFAALRTKESFVSASDFVAPADCWGDVSAATGPLLVALAAVAGAKAYSNGSQSFIWASSESGERGAALLDVRRTT
jgi:3-oxoacyl-[acyl-carrier-protein] synthase-1